MFSRILRASGRHTWVLESALVWTARAGGAYLCLRLALSLAIPRLCLVHPDLWGAFCTDVLRVGCVFLSFSEEGEVFARACWHVHLALLLVVVAAGYVWSRRYSRWVWFLAGYVALSLLATGILLARFRLVAGYWPEIEGRVSAWLWMLQAYGAGCLLAVPWVARDTPASPSRRSMA